MLFRPMCTKTSKITTTAAVLFAAVKSKYKMKIHLNKHPSFTYTRKVAADLRQAAQHASKSKSHKTPTRGELTPRLATTIPISFRDKSKGFRSLWRHSYRLSQSHGLTLLTRLPTLIKRQFQLMSMEWKVVKIYQEEIIQGNKIADLARIVKL